MTEMKSLATLFVHGICGHYSQFAGLPDIAARFGTSETFLLPGHGGAFSTLLKTGVDDWLGDVDQRLDRLSRSHDEVILVGHSLGALLSLYAAYKNPFRVKRIFLWAAPLGISRTSSLRQKLKYRRAQTPKTAGIRLTDLLSVGLPTPLEGLRMLPLLSDIVSFSKRCEIVYPTLPFDITGFQVQYDEVVDPDRSMRLLKTNVRANVHLLTESSHGALVSPERELVEATFQEILQASRAD